MDNSESYKLQEGPVMGRSSQYSEVYLQELEQIPTVIIRKIPLGFQQRRGKETDLKYTRALRRSQQGLPSGQTPEPGLLGYYPSPTDLGKGNIQLQSALAFHMGERKYLLPAKAVGEGDSGGKEGGLEKHMWSPDAQTH